MFYRILWTSIVGMLMIAPLHADYKIANLQESFARKFAGDSQSELYAEAHIDVDHDKWSELQTRGTAQITGGANMHDYYGQEHNYENIAHAYAYDFSHADADIWNCYNCTPNDELDTPCSKCGGIDTQGGMPVDQQSPLETPETPETPNPDEGGTEEGGGTGNLDGGTTTPTTYLADSSTRTLAPASGSNTYATAGSTHEASLTSSVAYDSVVWQVRTPSNTSHLVPTVETDTGDGTATDASMSYTFSAGVTGTYTIMAYVWYSDLSARAMSYDVTVTLSPGLRPINGSSYYANSGDTYEMGLVTDAPYSQVQWYVKPPGDTSTDGTNVETDTVTGTTTEAELSYTLPTGTPGNRRITAHIFRADGTNYKVTYDVYVY